MDNLNGVIAENLKRLRERKKMSLETVSKLSGVSKSMLGQIERGEVNPTITTVWKIANGLKISFTELINRSELECEVVTLSSISPLVEDLGRYRNYPVFTFDSERNFETYYIELDSGSHLEADPHPEGTVEFITVFSGTLEVTVNNTILVGSLGDSIRFKADTAHCYKNTGDEICRISMIIYYGK